MGTRLVVSDTPVPETAMNNEAELMSLTRAGLMNAVQFEIEADGASVSISILSNKLGGSVSVSKLVDRKEIPVFTSDRIAGAFSMAPSTLGSMRYRFNLRFETPITPRAAAPKAHDAAGPSAPTQAMLRSNTRSSK
jgi:hypothetical protein